jgi:hypothetical protein
MRFWQKAPLPSVTFATACWERDWKQILLDPHYLAQRQIANHLFPFAEKLLVINNVNDLGAVQDAAQKKIDEGVLSRYVVAEQTAKDLLGFFQLKREDFRPGPDAHLYRDVDADWIYFNALAPLTAIYCCQSDYLLYMTGDARLDEPVDWIGRALRLMEKKPIYKVANLNWSSNNDGAKKESDGKCKGFYVSSRGFSDQMFLVKCADVRAPIYGEAAEDAVQYPRGDVFEKRLFTAMRKRNWLRLTYSKGSYIHENF